ncbi:hypothetical protein CLV28_0758 [Sediminihabitans luteus]|uniref:Uncharacterized protein n=1 Tax=Sediminihabitans luteus TaxID=1138585 RepID=A0A2M9D073_9CELL|nr:hypothetical protein [Sediminihabitans luteus]PJJ77537.1 hypothetical protein CLV28_0758 [Sediminihabitans luteus]GII98436.1 hypothetical protein Slu03_08140 [Sediminihabitans luteus]
MSAHDSTPQQDPFEAELRAGLGRLGATAPAGALDAHLPTIARTARRRRAAKRTSAGALGVAAVAAVAVVGIQLPGDDGAIPAGPSPTSTSTVAPTGGFVDGSVPAWLEGTSLACGADATLLAAVPTTAAGTDVTITATAPLAATRADDGGWEYRLPYAFPAQEGTERLHGVRPTLAWVQHGRVVGLGAAPDPATATSWPADVRIDGEALADATDYCAPGPDGTYPATMPAGEYTVVAYGPVWTDEHTPGDEVWTTTAQASALVTLGADGAVTSSAIAGEAGAPVVPGEIARDVTDDRGVIPTSTGTAVDVARAGTTYEVRAACAGRDLGTGEALLRWSLLDAATGSGAPDDADREVAAGTVRCVGGQPGDPVAADGTPVVALTAGHPYQLVLRALPEDVTTATVVLAPAGD